MDGFDFIYLPSGRGLLPRHQEGPSPGSVVVLADPDFGAAPLAARPDAQGETPALATRSRSGEPSIQTPRASEAVRAWAATPLPGTRQEAEAIQRLVPQAQLFLGAEATRQRLLRVLTPGILHLATHGFFLEDAPRRPTARW